MGLAELGSMAGELAVPGGVRDQTAAPANAACAEIDPGRVGRDGCAARH